MPSGHVDKFAESLSDVEAGFGFGFSSVGKVSDVDHEVPRKLEQERIDSIGPFATYCADNALIWKLYMEQARASDDELSSLLNSDLDPLLIFAGLFSAILSAFLIEVRKGLQEDLQEVTNDLLRTAIQIQLNNTHPSIIPIMTQQFHSTATTRWVNGLWFSSLIVSLMSALSASMAKGWIAQFASAASGANWRDVSIRHKRFKGIRRWRLRLIIQFLPVLIHISFFLFAAGLVVLLWDDDVGIGGVISALIAAIIILYIGSTLHPIFSSDSPFRTPVSSLIIWLTTGHASSRNPRRLPRDTDAQKAEALAWLLEETSDTGVIQSCVTAVAGLSATLGVQDVLYRVHVVSILARGISEAMTDTSNTDRLAAYLHATLRLIQAAPSDARDDLTLSILRSLAISGGLLEKCREHEREIQELSVCIRARIFLLLFDNHTEAVLWDTDIPVRIKSCSDEHVRHLLTEVFVLKRSENQFLKQLRDENPEIRRIAHEELRSLARQGTTWQSCVAKIGVDTILQALSNGPSTIRDEYADKLPILANYKHFRQQMVEHGGVVKLASLLSLLSGQINEELREKIVHFMKLLDIDDVKALLSNPQMLFQMSELSKATDLGILSSTMGILTKWISCGNANMKEVICALISRLDDGNSEVRIRVVSGLMKFFKYDFAQSLLLEHGFTKALVGMLADQDLYIRREVRKTLWMLIYISETRESLLNNGLVLFLSKMLINQDGIIRKQIVRVLLKLCHHYDARVPLFEQSLTTILKTLGDQDRDIQCDVLRVLGKLCVNLDAQSWLLRHNAPNILVEMLTVQDGDVRLEVIRVLVILFDNDEARTSVLEQGIMKSLVEIIMYQDQDVRCEVQEALVKLINFSDARNLFLAQGLTNISVLMLTDTRLTVRQDIIPVFKSLCENGDTRPVVLRADALKIFVDLMMVENWSVRQEVNLALLNLFDHDDTRVFLLDLGVITLLVNMMTNPHWYVRYDAIRILRQLFNYDDALTLLLQHGFLTAIVDKSSDQCWDVRWEVVSALIKLFNNNKTRPLFIKNSLELLVSMLGDEYWFVRQEVVRALVQLFEEDETRLLLLEQGIISTLFNMLMDQDSDVRREVIQAFVKLFKKSNILSYIHEQQLVNLFVGMLSDQYWFIRREVVMALMQLFDNSKVRHFLVNEGLMKALVNMLLDEDVTVRREVNLAIVKIYGNSDAEFKNLLKQRLARVPKNSLTNQSSTALLQATQVFIEEPDDFDARTLLRQELLKSVTQSLTCRDAENRKEVIRVLRNLLENCEPKSDDARELLLEQGLSKVLLGNLKDQIPDVREEVINFLEELIDNAGARKLLIEHGLSTVLLDMLSDQNRKIRQEGIRVLVKLFEEDDSQVFLLQQGLVELLPGVITDEDWDIRRNGIQLIVKLSDHNSAQILFFKQGLIKLIPDMLRDQDREIRREGVHVFTKLSSSDEARTFLIANGLIITLVAMSVDRDPFVRKEVFKALVQLHANDEIRSLLLEQGFKNVLLIMLTDQDTHVRREAIEVLKQLFDNSKTRAFFLERGFIKAFMNMLMDTDMVIRREVIWSLMRLYNYDDALKDLLEQEGLMTVLVAMFTDREQIVRQEMVSFVRMLLNIADRFPDQSKCSLVKDIMTEIYNEDSEVRQFYTDILQRMLKLNDNRIFFWTKSALIHPNPRVTNVSIRVLLRILDNDDLRTYIISPDIWPIFLCSLHRRETRSQSLQALIKFAKHDDVRHCIINNSNIVNILLEMLKGIGHDVEEWAIGAEGLLAFELF